MSDPFIGEIAILPYTFAPRFWATCDGQILPIAANTALFAVIGNYFGGDGRTGMSLPDLRRRAPMHIGQGPGLSINSLGEKSGLPSVAVNLANLPAHNHAVTAKAQNANLLSADASGKYLATAVVDNKGQPAYDPAPTASEITGLAAPTLLPSEPVPHDNRQPFLAMQFCIALDGVFPSRN